MHRKIHKINSTGPDNSESVHTSFRSCKSQTQYDLRSTKILVVLLNSKCEKAALGVSESDLRCSWMTSIDEVDLIVSVQTK